MPQKENMGLFMLKLLLIFSSFLVLSSCNSPVNYTTKESYVEKKSGITKQGPYRQVLGLFCRLSGNTLVPRPFTETFFNSFFKVFPMEFFLDKLLFPFVFI